MIGYFPDEKNSIPFKYVVCQVESRLGYHVMSYCILTGFDLSTVIRLLSHIRIPYPFTSHALYPFTLSCFIGVYLMISRFETGRPLSACADNQLPRSVRLLYTITSVRRKVPIMFETFNQLFSYLCTHTYLNCSVR